MKTTYKIILGFTFLLFLGCSSDSNNSGKATEALEQNGPKSPVVNEKEKVPPSIPNI